MFRHWHISGGISFWLVVPQWSCDVMSCSPTLLWFAPQFSVSLLLWYNGIFYRKGPYQRLSISYRHLSMTQLFASNIAKLYKSVKNGKSQWPHKNNTCMTQFTVSCISVTSTWSFDNDPFQFRMSLLSISPSLLSKRSAHWFDPVLLVTPGHWSQHGTILSLSNCLWNKTALSFDTGSFVSYSQDNLTIWPRDFRKLGWFPCARHLKKSVDIYWTVVGESLDFWSSKGLGPSW